MNINWALLATYVVVIIIEIGLPVAGGIWLLRKYKSAWVLVVTGVAAYAIAQLIHIPALNGIQTLFTNGTLPTPAAKWIPLVNGLIVGGLTSLLENALRWVGFRVNDSINEKETKSFRSSIAFGVGHGGIEFAITGVLLAYSLATVLLYNPGAEIAKGVSTSAVQNTLSQITSYWGSPWYYGGLTLFEHLVTLASQIVLSIMVWRSVAKGNLLWLLWAVLYQTVTEGITSFLSGMNWGLWDIEGVLALILLLNVLMVYLFWTEEGGLDAEPEDEEDEGEDGNDGEDAGGDEEEEEPAEETAAEADSPAE